MILLKPASVELPPSHTMAESNHINIVMFMVVMFAMSVTMVIRSLVKHTERVWGTKPGVGSSQHVRVSCQMILSFFRIYDILCRAYIGWELRDQYLNLSTSYEYTDIQ